MKKNRKKLVYISIIILAIFWGGLFIFSHKKIDQIQQNNPDLNISTSSAIVASSTANRVTTTLMVKKFLSPISDAKSRVSKKPFGLKVSPTNSPVSPEKFSGYHTGVDFEITPAEQGSAVPIFAICNGTLVLKTYATGYGGVAVEQCKLDSQTVTVIYGHLKLASISNKVNEKLIAGKQIAILGKGYSSETAGERKHLHLGIHLGTVINLLGYVQVKADLGDWLDVINYL